MTQTRSRSRSLFSLVQEEKQEKKIFTLLKQISNNETEMNAFFYNVSQVPQEEFLELFEKISSSQAGSTQQKRIKQDLLKRLKEENSKKYGSSMIEKLDKRMSRLETSLDNLSQSLKSQPKLSRKQQAILDTCTIGGVIISLMLILAALGVTGYLLFSAKTQERISEKWQGIGNGTIQQNPDPDFVFNRTVVSLDQTEYKIEFISLMILLAVGISLLLLGYYYFLGRLSQPADKPGPPVPPTNTNTLNELHHLDP